jgi:hypothetical protein
MPKLKQCVALDVSLKETSAFGKVPIVPPLAEGVVGYRSDKLITASINIRGTMY